MDAVNINFITEGQLSLNEVSFALKEGELSSSLPCIPDMVYMNITTQEGRRLCVCLDKHGFQVVGDDHNTITSDKDSDQNPIFETVYSLMEYISPSYHKLFSEQLIKKLPTQDK